MKTLRELIETLPSPYSEQAIANTPEYDLDNIRRKNIYDALLCAFTWKFSPQGSDYWNQLLNEIYNGNI